VQPFFIISAFRTQERVVVLDETDTYHISPLLDFENATKLQTSQTLLAWGRHSVGALSAFPCPGRRDSYAAR
jgi:hypothetical protein